MTRRSDKVDRVQLWQTSFHGIECYEAQLHHHRFGKHFHDAYTIGMNRGGAGQCIHRSRQHHHHPGSFNCINPIEVHTGEVAANSDCWFFQNIYITPSALRQFMDQLEWPQQASLPCFSKIVVDDPSLQSAFQQAFSSLTGSYFQALEQQSYLLHFFAKLLSRHLQPLSACRTLKPEHKAVQQVKAYLEAHYAEPASTDELGLLVNLNPYYLIRCFHQQVGLPPHGYKKQCQLLRAKQALSGKESIAAIAIRCGFYDQSHLNRVFKQSYGMTPGQYRKASNKRG
ncbi:AraC family transcriptional regulator [cf. Phormidesmis sp. LEGE 11477]|uniref:helix-turn-helix domain-containing protein n=1 Tax=cf. Phormidesmis sp. LEGE 11477 TaxID=1828680 RepID=UPI0018815B8D|nr:AraC family transcriptional regulator [cf. Phormidesmis sp. LEGE 11477]MBE9061679.1 AraC family transcriptional regulator [cf. Phormidesmis sp. LEGE 11477]